MPTLIAVVTCKRYEHRTKSQLATWIPQMIQAGYDVQLFDGEKLGVSDEYIDLPSKTKALCKWALDHGYTNMLKVDDDAYIWIDRFKVVPGDYVGIKVRANDGGHGGYGIPDYPRGHFPYDYASGGSYWLSDKSMAIIAAAPLTDDWAEDRWVGDVLARNNITLLPVEGYGCDASTPILQKNFAVLAQIPDGGIDKLVLGLEPCTVLRRPDNNIQRPQIVVRPALPQGRPAGGTVRTIRRNFGRR